MSIVVVLEQAGCLSREHEGRVRAQRQLTCVQWAVPAQTGCLVVLNALHGEQQHPMAQLHGMGEHVLRKDTA
ncbi:hypothetical protein [Streptomyces sp. HO565]|uniref:hypothetical protein n=1 Tax=Streptomyces sp. HO565 TaxID=2857489 RepID=UPI0034DC086C